MVFCAFIQSTLHSKVSCGTERTIYLGEGKRRRDFQHLFQWSVNRTVAIAVRQPKDGKDLQKMFFLSETSDSNKQLFKFEENKLLGLFPFGAAPVSTRHRCGCEICVRFGQLILGTLTKIDGESRNNFNDLCNRYKS